MLVYALIKIPEHPNPTGPGANAGDISSIYPIGLGMGKKVLNYYFPIRIDLTIPCGTAFQNFTHNCNSCPYNDIEDCDVIKYTIGLWSDGDVEDPPVLLKKRKYYWDRSVVTNPTIEALLLKNPKTEEEKAQVLSLSNSFDVLKADLEEKT